MTWKRAILRELAAQDTTDTLDHLLVEKGTELAERFIQTLEEAIAHSSRYPQSGSPRFGHELDLPGLRTWRVKGFPYALFYVEHDDWLDVWRVLHLERDIPRWIPPP